MATHPSILAWRIPRTEKPGGATVHGVAKSQTRLSISAPKRKPKNSQICKDAKHTDLQITEFHLKCRCRPGGWAGMSKPHCGACGVTVIWSCLSFGRVISCPVIKVLTLL